MTILSEQEAMALATHRKYDGSLHRLICSAYDPGSEQRVIVHEHLYPQSRQNLICSYEEFYEQLNNGLARFRQLRKIKITEYTPAFAFNEGDEIQVRYFESLDRLEEVDFVKRHMERGYFQEFRIGVKDHPDKSTLMAIHKDGAFWVVGFIENISKEELLTKYLVWATDNDGNLINFIEKKS